MVQINLISLLARREIVHPSSIISAELVNEQKLSINIKGVPWWRDVLKAGDESVIAFVFDGVTDGCLDLGIIDSEYDEALESFKIFYAEDCDWAQEYGFEIYCSAPLQDPFKLYSIVSDYVIGNRSMFGVTDYLNTGAGHYLHNFEKIVTSRSYMLARAPKVLCEKICSELDRQGVKYKTSASCIRNVGKIVVQLEGSTFFCSNAVAVYDE